MGMGGASSAVMSGAQSSIVEEKSLLGIDCQCSGRSRGGTGPPFNFWTKLRPEGAKKCFGDPPSLISGSVRPAPPDLKYASYRCLFLKWIHHREGDHLECRPLKGVPLKFEKYWQLSALLCYASA